MFKEGLVIFGGVTNSWCKAIPRAQTFPPSADDCVVVDVV